jgi:hypothetical protein
MNLDDAVQTVAKKGFTERQARFLVLVARHAGVCVMRQYSAFAGIVFGQKTRKFFAKLESLGWVSTYDCAHNRARIYHLRHRDLYAAIGEPESRLRRPPAVPRALERLMVLDTILEHPGRVAGDTRREGCAPDNVDASSARRSASRGHRPRRRAAGPVLPGSSADWHSSRGPSRTRLPRRRSIARRVPIVPPTPRSDARRTVSMDRSGRSTGAHGRPRCANAEGCASADRGAAAGRDPRRTAVVLRAIARGSIRRSDGCRRRTFPARSAGIPRPTISPAVSSLAARWRARFDGGCVAYDQRRARCGCRQDRASRSPAQLRTSLTPGWRRLRPTKWLSDSLNRRFSAPTSGCR